MFLQVRGKAKRFPAHVAIVRLFTSVNQGMPIQIVPIPETIPANVTLMRPLPGVDHDVLLQGDRETEPLPASLALVRLLAAVGQRVVLQALRESETLPAGFALVRLLPGVVSEVRLERAELGEDFPARFANVRWFQARDVEIVHPAGLLSVVRLVVGCQRGLAAETFPAFSAPSLLIVNRHVALQVGQMMVRPSAFVTLVQLLAGVDGAVNFQMRELEKRFVAGLALVFSSVRVVNRNVLLEVELGFQRSFAYFAFVECVFFTKLHKIVA